MKCPRCETPNRPGASRCRRCTSDLPRSCPGCGDPIGDGPELCINCRTERVPAALGADLEELEDQALLEEEQETVAFPIAPRLVGRAELLARLEQAVAAAEQCREVTFLALTGEPGTGKTRLTEELQRRIPQNHPRARVLRTRCGGPGAPPFAAFERLLGARFGVNDSDSADRVRERILAGTAELIAGPQAIEVAHLLAQLVGLPFADSAVVEPLADTPSQLEARTFMAVRRLFAAEAARGPLLLIFDDIERATPETVNLIRYLAAGLAGSPLVLLAAGRSSVYEVHPCFASGDGGLARMEVGPLDEEESLELFRELARPAGTPPPELLTHARERMGGVPRALVELVRYLVEAGVIEDASQEGAWRFNRERLHQVPLPSELDELLAERLRAMDAGERALLEKAAAIGEAFWLDAVVALVRAAALDRDQPDGPTLGEVAAAGDRTRAEVAIALSRAARRGILVEAARPSIPGEREYRFSYTPLRDVVYDGIDSVARQRYHRLIAQWLELRPDGRGEEAQEEIGRHLERAGNGEGASLRFRRAADAARARYYNDKAVRLYLAALGCLGEGDLSSRIHLWHDLGSVFQLKGEFEGAIDAFERMLRLAWVVASRTKAAVAFNKIGRVHRQQGALPLALEFLERGLALFEQAADARGVAGSLDDLGQVLWLLARYDEALERAHAALESRRALGDRRSIAVSLVNIGNIERHRGFFDEADACYREALEIRTALADGIGIAQAENALAVLAFLRGDVEGARGRWQSALDLSEDLGALPLQAMLLNHLGEAALYLGQRKEARTRFESAEALARDLDDKRLLSEALRNLGMLDLTIGDRKRAAERCAQALSIADAAGIRVDVGRALLALGEVHASTLFDDGVSRLQEAGDYFRRGVQLFREIGNDAELAIGLERFGKYRVERGDVAEGRGLLSEAQVIFSRLGMRAGDAVRRMIGDL